MRQNFSIVKKAYTKLGKGNIRLTQSNLMLIRPINPNSTTYNFPVVENEVVGLLPEEIRLNINDEFIMTHLGVYLRGTLNNGEGGLIAPIMHTYAPIQQNRDFAKSEGLYDGYMKLSVNNITYIDKYGLRKHENRPVSPQWNNQIAVGLNGSTEAAAKFSDDGVYEISPMVTFSGAKKNELQIILPKAIQTSSSAFTDNSGNALTLTIDSIAINVFGYLGQNGAKFQ
jgi:hypothetical protein